MTPAEASRSIVVVHSSVPEDAFTASVLGTERSGSGVVIRDDGLVLTIGYLITEADNVMLTTAGNRVVPAHPLAYDQVTGFGLVQALGRLDIPAVSLGDSGKARLGDKVVFAGGMGQSVDAKVIAKQEFAGYWEYLLDEAIFTSPAHPSWGGAGLIGEDGTLIGIGSLRLQMAGKGGPQDINMAVPINLLPPVLDDLLQLGRINRPARPWLGVFAADNDGKVVTMNVDSRGPAADAGLRAGDVIADVRNLEVESLADFYRKVWASGDAGIDIPIRIIRDRRDMWLRIKSADRNSFLKKPVMQ